MNTEGLGKEEAAGERRPGRGRRQGIEEPVSRRQRSETGAGGSDGAAEKDGRTLVVVLEQPERMERLVAAVMARDRERCADLPPGSVYRRVVVPGEFAPLDDCPTAIAVFVVAVRPRVRMRVAVDAERVLTAITDRDLTDHELADIEKNAVHLWGGTVDR